MFYLARVLCSGVPFILSVPTVGDSLSIPSSYRQTCLAVMVPARVPPWFHRTGLPITLQLQFALVQIHKQ